MVNDGSKGSDYIIKVFNKTSLEIEGKTLDQVVGKSLFDLRPTIDDYGLVPILKKVWETGAPAYFPIKIYEDDKFSNYYENYVFKIPSGEVVTIYNDITEQKNAELALKESEERFDLAMKLQDAVEFSVHNDAVMSRDVQLQIFQRSFSTKGHGRGIGTYSMKLLGEKYLKGSVWFKSAEGAGTTMFLALPLQVNH